MKKREQCKKDGRNSRVNQDWQWKCDCKSRRAETNPVCGCVHMSESRKIRYSSHIGTLEGRTSIMKRVLRLETPDVCVLQNI